MTKTLAIIIGLLLFLWLLASLWANAEGASRLNKFGNLEPDKTALIVYDPDPFYKFDEQICNSFANGLAEKNWNIIVASVKATKNIEASTYDLYVFCANTYNSKPDSSIVKYIKSFDDLADMNIVLITLGAGTTDNSKAILEKLINEKKGKYLDSKAYWWARPNDEARKNEKNVVVAKELAKLWAIDLDAKIAINF